MRVQSFYKVKQITGFLFGLIICSLAFNSYGANVNVSPVGYGYGTDGGADFGWDINGSFDLLTIGTDVRNNRYQSLDFTKRFERRGAFEFSLPSVLSQPGVILNSAILVTTATSASGQLYDNLNVYGYSADGTITLNDFANVQNQVGSLQIYTSLTAKDYQFDVTNYVTSLIGNSSHAGFVTAVSGWGAYATLTPNAELQITYTVTDPSVNTAPSISIVSPQANVTYYENTPILVSATAMDAEDGDITANIIWSWPFYPLPSGPSFTTTVFYPGTHTITAWITDTAGVTTSKQATFTVLANTPPVLNIISPFDGTQLTEGNPLSLQASANDAEQGDLSATITWSSNISGVLGSGAILNVNLVPGTHTITATVMDVANVTTTATVTITVFAITNSPPQVSIISPANNAAIAAGLPIVLQGSASDAEDGDLSAAIQWSSNLDGVIGSGASIASVNLSIGTHIVSATVSDSWGDSTSTVVNVTVGNGAIVYCSASGTNTNYEWLESITAAGVTKVSGKNNGYADFTSEVPLELLTGDNNFTLMPGFLSGSYNEYWGIWIDFNQDGIFASSEQVYSGNSMASLNAVVTIPAGMIGTTRMRVEMRYGSAASPCGTFTYGEVEDYLVNITEGNVPPPPGPGSLSYCPSRGSNNSYEWIQAVNVNGYTYTSGASGGGYSDNTNGVALTLTRGANSISMTPGFVSSSYTEYWNVWVDTNQDGQFSAPELLYSGVSSSSLSANLALPVTVLSGSTRMRVSMKYSGAATACEMFTYGEVEDFKVNIP